MDRVEGDVWEGYMEEDEDRDGDPCVSAVCGDQFVDLLLADAVRNPRAGLRSEAQIVGVDEHRAASSGGGDVCGAGQDGEETVVVDGIGGDDVGTRRGGGHDRYVGSAP